MSICLLDTSVFVEILRVPDMDTRAKEIASELRKKIDEKESLFLPMATILETGNHIAQHGDGNSRRKAANRFVAQVQLALDGKSPFTTVSFQNTMNVRGWLASFPDSAMRGQGLGDLSIIYDWREMCALHPMRLVYIWSLDRHLSAYSKEANTGLNTPF